MGNSETVDWKKSSKRIAWILAVVIILAEAGIIFWNWQFRQSISGLAFNQSLLPNMAFYRYKFGGAINTHYLNDVTTVTVYRRPEAIDQVVFSQTNTDYYVLNSDILIDYKLSPQTVVEKNQVMNTLFNHYDPYLQGEKQEMHRQWVIEQYQKYTGRTPTDAEWLEALNELTRGVEHYQMERWIKYSPPAVEHWLTSHLPQLINTAPNEEEKTHLIKLLQSGITYEQIESSISTKTSME